MQSLSAENRFRQNDFVNAPFLKDGAHDCLPPKQDKF